MWVADMDFAAPPAVLEALQARIDHGVFGYADPWPSVLEAVIEGIARDHAWRIQPDWLVWLPGVVTGFNVAVRAVGQPGDGVFTATPVYPPFLHAPANFGQRLVTAPLVQRPALGLGLARHRGRRRRRGAPVHAVQPHNPVGRVFDRDELTRIAELAERHDLVICSDEIHCGLVLDPATPHIPIAALDDAVARRTITLMAPSKTWNIPALYCAFAIIPDAGLRARYKRAMAGIVPHVNVLGLTATEVAYRDCGPWRRRCWPPCAATRPGRRGHQRPARPRHHAGRGHLPGLDRLPRLLAAKGIANAARHFEQAGVGLSDGKDFGLPGFVRLNFGCPPARLEEGLARIRRAVTG
jgi:cystathionine beta-lyase